jgi:muconolactone delta-isomerase
VTNQRELDLTRVSLDPAVSEFLTTLTVKLPAWPMFAWLDIETVALTRHPSDPGTAAADN